MEHALERQIPQKYWSRLQKGEIIEEEDKTYLPEMVLGPPRKGIKLTYCTDTRPTESIAKMPKIPIYLSVKVCMQKKRNLQKRNNINI